MKRNYVKPGERNGRKTVSCGGDEHLPHHCGFLMQRQSHKLYSQLLKQKPTEFHPQKSCIHLRLSFKSLTEPTNTCCNLLLRNLSLLMTIYTFLMSQRYCWTRCRLTLTQGGGERLFTVRNMQWCQHSIFEK